MNLKLLFPLSTISTLFLVSTTAQEQPACKVVETVANFDIELYAAAPWYVQMQAETSYTPLDQNYCSRAQYEVRDSKTLWGYTVDVKNEAEDADGNEFGGPLCAFQDRETASKLAVAPCFLPKFLAGPYWIVSYDEDEGYALVSGGQPTFPGENGCRTGTGVNNSGLWIFTRSQPRDQALIDVVLKIAEDAGFDVSVLNDVVQDGCDYSTPSCANQEGTFSAGFGRERNCDWVDSFRSLRCLFFGNECPDTCAKCPAE